MAWKSPRDPAQDDDKPLKERSYAESDADDYPEPTMRKKRSATDEKPDPSTKRGGSDADHKPEPSIKKDCNNFDHKPEPSSKKDRVGTADVEPPQRLYGPLNGTGKWVQSDAGQSLGIASILWKSLSSVSALGRCLLPICPVPNLPVALRPLSVVFSDVFNRVFSWPRYRHFSWPMYRIFSWPRYRIFSWPRYWCSEGGEVGNSGYSADRGDSDDGDDPGQLLRVGPAPVALVPTDHIDADDDNPPATPPTALSPASDEEVVLNSHGDLILVVGKPGTAVRRFRVGSRSLASTSPRWEKILFGKHLERERQEGARGDWSVMLPEDPDVLVILLWAIYGHLRSIPEKLSCDQLLHLVIICEDYGSIGALKAFWDRWINSVEPGRCNLETITSRLEIAYTLGHTHYSAAVLVALLARLRVVGERRMSWGDDDEDGYGDWNRLVFNGDLGDEKLNLDAHLLDMWIFPGSLKRCSPLCDI